MNRICSELESRGIEEVITTCPNCYYFLKERIPQKVRSIYEVLPELVPEISVPEGIEIQIPCPDRTHREWYDAICKLLGYEPAVTSAEQCCGLGGMASAEEPALAKKFGEGLTSSGLRNTTFCAACAGQYARNGKEIRHVLSLLLGMDEAPATKTSYLNRVKTKYK